MWGMCFAETRAELVPWQLVCTIPNLDLNRFLVVVRPGLVNPWSRLFVEPLYSPPVPPPPPPPLLLLLPALPLPLEHFRQPVLLRDVSLQWVNLSPAMNRN